MAKQNIEVKAFEMIELPIFESEETFMAKVAITNKGDFIRFSDISRAIAMDSFDMLGKLVLFAALKEQNKEKLSNDPEDETGFFVNVDSLNTIDGEIYDQLTVEKGDWLKENVVPRIFLKPEKEIPQPIKPEGNGLEDILKSIDNKLNKIQETLDTLLEEDEEEDNDCKIKVGSAVLTKEQYKKLKNVLGCIID